MEFSRAVLGSTVTQKTNEYLAVLQAERGSHLTRKGRFQTNL